MYRILLALALLMSAACGFATVTQTGYVKTRGRLDNNGQVIPGQRLASVTIVLQSGSSVVSNQSGDFILTLPANKFYLNNVKKDGYVVSDPDILSKQYAYSVNPLVLVLDEPTTQLNDKLACERKLRNYLTKQLQQRDEELEALKEENKITQEQYLEAMQKLYSDQTANQNFISEMVERYSKIDFDQLDDFQRQMAAFIQNGELVLADSLLRTKGSMDDREAELRRIQEANAKERKELAAREENLAKNEKNEAILLVDLGADYYSRFEICKLKFDNDSAAYWIERRANLDPSNAYWQNDAGNFLAGYVSMHSSALNYFNRALDIIKDGQKDKIEADVYKSIGAVYCTLNKYPDAIDNYQRSLDIIMEINSEDKLSIANIYNNLGVVYSDQSQYKQGLEYFNKAYEIIIENYGEDHPDLIGCYNNLGMRYYNSGNYEKGLDYLKKAVELSVKLYGDDNEKNITIYNNIGSQYLYQKVYDLAADFFDKSLNISLKVYGKKHLKTAAAYLNIGSLNTDKKDYQNALINYNQALDIYTNIYGPAHRAVGICCNNIASTYSYLKDYGQALDYFTKTLSIYKEVLAENDAQVAYAYNNIGVTYMKIGDFDNAIENYKKSHSIRLEIFGEKHPKTALSYYNIATLYFNHNDYPEALEHYEKALEIRTELFGEDHTDVIKVKEKIAEVKSKMEKNEKS